MNQRMTQRIKFTVLHVQGSNNHFMLIDEDELPRPLVEAEYPKLAVALHANPQWFKTDGVLYYKTVDPARQRIAMRMFNPNGSEAQMCGNGLRCAGRYGMEKLACDEVAVDTPQHTLMVKRQGEVFAGIDGYSSQIGPITMNIESMKYTNKPPERPFVHRSVYTLDGILDDRIRYTALKVPNPHFIGISYKPYLHPQVAEAFREINRLGYFPEGVNLSIVCKMPALKNGIFVVTCERGVGPTNACGTAMAASSLIAAMLDFADATQPIEVFNPGGFVTVQLPRSEGYQNPLRGPSVQAHSDDQLLAEQNNGLINLNGNATWVNEFVADYDAAVASVTLTLNKQYSEESRLYKTMSDFAQNTIDSNFPDLIKLPSKAS